MDDDQANAEPLDEQQIAAAVAQVRSLLHRDSAPTAEEVIAVESTLRPLAPVPMIQEAMVPLLDRVSLASLAMIWDIALPERSPDELKARAIRWRKLGAPELALLTLAELIKQNHEIETAKRETLTDLEAARPQRQAVFQRNLDALRSVQPEVAQLMLRCPRSWIPLYPLGSGIASHGPHGGPIMQLWAVTPEAAHNETEHLLNEVRNASLCLIAGVGDGTLPVGANRRLGRAENWLADPGLVHTVEPFPPRLRALLEADDLSEAILNHRLMFHVGPSTLESLPQAVRGSRAERSAHVIGNDPNAVALIRQAFEAT